MRYRPTVFDFSGVSVCQYGWRTPSDKPLLNFSELKEEKNIMSRSGNILAVDDDVLNRGVIERIVARKGHSVTLASDGKEALHKIRQGAFDLVLLDIMMPGIDGLGVLREIRQYYSMSALPVIMVSALNDSDTVVELLNLGANDYMTKPVDAKILQARVTTQLNVINAHKKVSVLPENVNQHITFQY